MLLFHQSNLLLTQNGSQQQDLQTLCTSFHIKYDEWVKDECFYEKRKNGQNDDLICQFIQKDLIDDFIAYINKNSYSLNSKIIYTKPGVTLQIKIKNLEKMK